MNNPAKVGCATLSIMLVAYGDTAIKPSSNGESTISPSSILPTDFSAWTYVLLIRGGVMPIRGTKDFNDTRFEYRWKSDWVVNRHICTVEIRPMADIGASHTVSLIRVMYSDPYGHGHAHDAHDITIGGNLAHAYIRRDDCERVQQVWWRKD